MKHFIVIDSDNGRFALYGGFSAPWFSVDAEPPVSDFRHERQERIDVCLRCRHEASACDRCDGAGNLAAKNSAERLGSYDPDRLREMLRLKVCKRDMANRLGISRASLYRYIRRMKQETTVPCK